MWRCSCTTRRRPALNGCAGCSGRSSGCRSARAPWSTCSSGRAPAWRSKPRRCWNVCASVAWCARTRPRRGWPGARAGNESLRARCCKSWRRAAPRACRSGRWPGRGQSSGRRTCIAIRSASCDLDHFVPDIQPGRFSSTFVGTQRCEAERRCRSTTGGICSNDWRQCWNWS